MTTAPRCFSRYQTDWLAGTARALRNDGRVERYTAVLGMNQSLTIDGAIVFGANSTFRSFDTVVKKQDGCFVSGETYGLASVPGCFPYNA